MRSKISRRSFLRFTGGAVGVAFLAACAPVTPGGGAAAPSKEAVTIRYAGLESMGASLEKLSTPGN